MSLLGLIDALLILFCPEVHQCSLKYSSTIMKIYRSESGARTGSGFQRQRLASISFATLAVLCNTAELLAEPAAAELPTGGQVVAGNASISSAGDALRVSQTSDRAVINWQSFNIGRDSRVEFVQPGIQSVALNRVVSANPSQIYGQLSSNGQIYLVNPSGVLFGKGASVSVGGLVAATMSIDNETFMSGVNRFTRNGSLASVINQGAISSTDGGTVALLASDVENDGLISARLGSVILASGEAMTLTQGDGLWSIQLDPATVSGLVRNGGIVQADGGQVVMRASTSDTLVGSVVNTGEVRARTIGQKDGRILLIGDMESGKAEIGGLLDASAPDGGNGGFIETSAAKVTVADGTNVTTHSSKGGSGTWLIDPSDFTIAGDKAGSISGGSPTGDISGATLSSALALGNVTILSSQGSMVSGSGDINVNDNVTWWNNTLTLTAARNININAVMSVCDTNPGAAIDANDARLVMNTATANGVDAAVSGGNVLVGLSSAGFSGRVDFDRAGAGVLTINGSGYTIINSLGSSASATGTDLQGISGAAYRSGKYALGCDIDASATATWNSGAGFNPIAGFTGVFDGLGHVIAGLTINRPGTDYVGLFGYPGNYVTNGPVRNVGLDVKQSGANVIGGITGRDYVGAFLGRVYEASGSFTNVYNRLPVTGRTYVGGLAGMPWSASVTNSFNTGNVTGVTYVGGIVGRTIYGPLRYVFNTGNVSGTTRVGGLVGCVDSGGSINYSYNTGDVTGVVDTSVTPNTNPSQIGGLVGYCISTLNNSYNTGNVDGGVSGDYVGGVIGKTESYPPEYNYLYNTGAVSGRNYVGGLIGELMLSAQLLKSYNTGNVSGTMYVGGLAGHSNNYIRQSYNTGSVTGVTDVGGLVGWNSRPLVDNINYGAVSGTTNVGGIVGWDTGDVYNNINVGTVTGISNGGTTPSSIAALIGLDEAAGKNVSYNYADTSITGALPLYGAGSTATTGMFGLSHADMQNVSKYAGFSISDSYNASKIWRIYSGYTYPILRWTLTPVTVTAGSVTRQYDGTAYSGGPGVTYSIAPIPSLNGSLMYAGTSQGARSAGTYVITPSGLWSTVYDINAVNGTLTITRKPLTVSADGVDREYNGNNLGSVLLSSADKVTGDLLTYRYTSATFADKNVETDKALGVSGISISGTAAANYILQNTTATTVADITPKYLEVTGVTGVSRVYDATLETTVSGTPAISPFSGDVVYLGGTAIARFADKHVGTGKSLTVSGYEITGADAGNYRLVQPSGLVADIWIRDLPVEGLRARNKMYDGTTLALLGGDATVHRQQGDDVILEGTPSALFNNADVATGKPVTVSGLSISGSDSGNYRLIVPQDLVADIEPMPVTATVMTDQVPGGSGKQGNALVLMSLDHADLVSDDLRLTYAPAFSSGISPVTAPVIVPALSEEME